MFCSKSIKSTLFFCHSRTTGTDGAFSCSTVRLCYASNSLTLTLEFASISTCVLSKYDQAIHLKVVRNLSWYTHRDTRFLFALTNTNNFHVSAWVTASVPGRRKKGSDAVWAQVSNTQVTIIQDRQYVYLQKGYTKQSSIKEVFQWI